MYNIGAIDGLIDVERSFGWDEIKGLCRKVIDFVHRWDGFLFF